MEIPKQRNVTIWPQFAIVDKSSYHAARINVSRNTFLNFALWRKNNFLWCLYRVKNKSKCGFVVRTLINNGYALLLFSQTMFSNSICMLTAVLSEFAKVFESWRVQVAHLLNAARTLSSRSRCFQLSTNLNKDFFRYLEYCGIKQI